MILHLDVVGAEINDAGYGPVLRVLVKLTAPDGTASEHYLHQAWGGEAPTRIAAGCNIPVSNYAN